METRTWRRILLALVLGAVLAGAPSSRSWAHQGGRVQLHLDRLSAAAEGPGTWRLSVRLVDFDSGGPAAGFAVTVAGTGADGAAFGPVVLADATNRGEYTGVMEAPAGSWTATVRADEVPGGDPAVPLVKTLPLELAASPGTGAASEPPDRAEAPDPRAEEKSRFAVRLERGTEVGQVPNWVSLRTTITDRESGAGVSEGLEVYVTGAGPDGVETETFALVPQAEDGVFAGFVIVPRGGAWTFTASVNRRRPEGDRDPPLTYAQDRLEADVVAGTLESASGTENAGGTGFDEGIAANPMEAAVLWTHTLVALAWITLVALLALFVYPAGRRLLSDRGIALLDSRLDVTIRAVGWLTAAVVVTGVYNIIESTPYRVPFSASRLNDVFGLPYGRPYYLTLGLKLATYAAMLAATVPILSRARRVSRGWSPAPDPRTGPPAAPQRSPWNVVVPVSVGAGAVATADDRATGNLAALPAPVAHTSGSGSSTAATSTRAAPVASPPVVRPARLPALVIGAGAVLLTLAVTLLKFFHLLTEAARSV